jgi:hypothetical protein
MMRAKYVWSTPLGSIDHWVLAGKMLHAGGLKSTPWEFKVPFIASSLPIAIAEHRLVSAMHDIPKGDVTCRAVAIPKFFHDEYKTTFVIFDNRKMEYMLCAHICGDAWLVHPGRNLDPIGLTKHEVREGVKRKRTSAVPPLKLDPIMPCDSLSKLMAVANHHAEIERAKVEGRDVDLERADALFEKDPFVWHHTPKKVLALWSSTIEGTVKHSVDEIPFPSKALRL